MKVGVVFAADKDRHALLTVDVAAGTTARQAIESSGIMKRFPEIDLDKHKVGIFGKAATLDSVVEEGDRVEIYRPITADPKKVPRRKAAPAPAPAKADA